MASLPLSLSSATERRGWHGGNSRRGNARECGWLTAYLSNRCWHPLPVIHGRVEEESFAETVK